MNTLVAFFAFFATTAPCGADSFFEPSDPFNPNEAIALIQRASTFYFWNFSVQNPPVDPSDKLWQHLTEEEKSMFKNPLEWYMRIDGQMGTVDGLRTILAEYYSPKIIDYFMSRGFNHFPDLHGLVIYNGMIFTSWGDRGSNLFLELFWDKAYMKVIEQKESPQGPLVITKYFLPAVDRFEKEDANGDFYYEEVPLLFEEEVEFLWYAGRWKLNTFIDTFDM